MSKPGTVAIVGGGVIGVCSAYYLARDGWDVTIIERGPDVASGSSYGNAGLVVPSHSIPLAAPGVWVKGLKWMGDPESPFYIRPRVSPDLVKWLWTFRANCTKAHVERAVPLLHDLNLKSLELFREFSRMDGMSFGFDERGLVMAFRTRESMEEAVKELELQGEAAAKAKVFYGDAAREVEPALAPGLAGGIFQPEDAHLIPDRFVTSLARLIEGLGVKILRNTEVLGFRVDGRTASAVETTRGDFSASEVVIAAGSWSPAFAKVLKIRLPIQPAKGYSVTWRRPEGGPKMPVMFGEARAALTPMGDTLRVAGTLELAGMDLSINRRRVEALKRAASSYVSGLGALEVLEVWRGLRPCTPDGLPIVGRAPRIGNVTLATGHAMVGMSLGPVTGKLVSQIVGGEAPLRDISLLRPERFG